MSQVDYFDEIFSAEAECIPQELKKRLLRAHHHSVLATGGACVQSTAADATQPDAPIAPTGAKKKNENSNTIESYKTEDLHITSSSSGTPRTDQPVRPVSPTVTAIASTRGRRFPSNWTPSDELREHMYRCGCNVEATAKQIQQWCRNADRRNHNWDDYLIFEWTLKKNDRDWVDATTMNWSRQIVKDRRNGVIRPVSAAESQAAKIVADTPSSTVRHTSLSVSETAPIYPELVERCKAEGVRITRLNGKNYFPKELVEMVRGEAARRE